MRDLFVSRWLTTFASYYGAMLWNVRLSSIILFLNFYLLSIDIRIWTWKSKLFLFNIRVVAFHRYRSMIANCMIGHITSKCIYFSPNMFIGHRTSSFFQYNKWRKKRQSSIFFLVYISPSEGASHSEVKASLHFYQEIWHHRR